MECFFAEFSVRDSEVQLEGDEFRHFRALRKAKGEIVILVNGKGLSAFGYVKSISKDKALIKINNFVDNLGEIDQKISLAMGILDNKERFEFALEKAVELRISEFIPLRTEFTQRKEIDLARLEKKAISAIKQTVRSRLPSISLPVDLKSLAKTFRNYDYVFVLDRAGNKELPKVEFNSALIIVGPEGGLSKKEIDLCRKRKNSVLVSLGDFRLRSETSAIAFLSVLHFNLL